MKNLSIMYVILLCFVFCFCFCFSLIRLVCIVIASMYACNRNSIFTIIFNIFFYLSIDSVEKYCFAALNLYKGRAGRWDRMALLNSHEEFSLDEANNILMYTNVKGVTASAGSNEFQPRGTNFVQFAANGDVCQQYIICVYIYEAISSSVDPTFYSLF